MIFWQFSIRMIFFFYINIYVERKNLLFVVYCKTLKIKAIAYFLIVKRLNIKILITFSKNVEKSFQNFVLFYNFFKIIL